MGRDGVRGPGESDMNPWYEIDSRVAAAQLATDPEKGLAAAE